jgi:EpsI family protein
MFSDASLPRPPLAWPVAVVAVPLLALLATLWPALHFVWVERSAYSHGYLVLGICLYLGYRELRRGVDAPRQPSLVGFGVLAGLVVVAAAGRAADVALATQFAIPGIALAALWAAAGWAFAKRFWLPAAYAIFAIPFWDSINELLRTMTVGVVSWMTRQSAIPAFIEGNTIRIPSGTFVVEGGCSGLHYLIVACALSVLYGVLTFERWLPRLYALGFGIVLALVANWIRVFVVIVAGHVTEMQHYLVTVDHYYFGWILFFVVFAPLLLFGRHLDALAPARPSPTLASRAAAAPRSPSSHNSYVVATGLLLAAGTALSALANARPEAPAETLKTALPAQIDGWTREGGWDGGSRPRFGGADAEGTGRYALAGSHVSVFWARYVVQRQGKEVVIYSNLPSGENASVVARATARVEPTSGKPASLAELEVVDPDGTRRMVWYGYEIAGRRTADPVRAKLYQVVGAFRGRWDAQVIVASSACAPDCGGARKSLARWMAPGYEALLARVAEETSE